MAEILKESYNQANARNIFKLLLVILFFVSDSYKWFLWLNIHNISFLLIHKVNFSKHILKTQLNYIYASFITENLQ